MDAVSEQRPAPCQDIYAVQWPFSKGKMRAVRLMGEFALGAAVEVVGARVTVGGMAAGVTSVHCKGCGANQHDMLHIRHLTQ